MSDTCETCRFFDLGKSGPLGTCRRYPPKPEQDPIWATDWCGEHQPTSGVRPSPGLQWLWDNGKRPRQYGFWRWYIGTDESPDTLPDLVWTDLHDAKARDGDEREFAFYTSETAAMLAAARAIESSQWLAFEDRAKSEQR